MIVRSFSYSLFLLAAFCFGSCKLGMSQSRGDITEKVIFIPSVRDASIRYETTVYTPPQPDITQPIVIINHGTNPEKRQGRDREVQPAKFFTHLGWTVVIPMRRGYSESTGERIKLHDCNLTRYGLDNAADVKDVVDWLETQDTFKNRKIVMIGQSTGGLTTMAYSSFADSRISALINFHGGMRPNSPTDCLWDARLKAFESYGAGSSPPSLWFYTANDHSSNPKYISRLYKVFTSMGGTAELHQLPPFKSDGHYLFGDADGGPIWQPIVLHYLRERNLLPASNE